MNEEELEVLFAKLAKHYGIIPENSKLIVVRLVQIALKYRDMLVQKGEETLTIEETRKALDELMQVLQNKKFSDRIPSRIKMLVTLWYEDVKSYLYH